MPLQAHPLHASVEGAEVAVPVLKIHQAGCARLLPVAHGHIDHEVFFPRQEGVAHQTRDVVGDGAVHRILEVEHAELLRGGVARLRGQHQISRHEVAVHIHLRRGQVVGHDGIERFFQRARLRVSERESLVLLQVPVGEQLQLAPQQGFVVGGEHTGPRVQLPYQQRIEGLHVASMVGLRVAGIDAVQHGLVAQICKQHETLRLVPGQHLGDQQSGLAHEAGHLYKRLAVLMRRGRVHHDQAVTRLRIDAQVAAKTRVGRRRAQGRRQQGKSFLQRRQPLLERGLPRGIGPRDSGDGQGHDDVGCRVGRCSV